MGKTMKEGTKTTSYFVVMLTVAFSLALSSSASAVVVFQETFDLGYTDGSSLIGQLNPNGDTW